MTAVPVPRTWVAGEVVTATEMNANVSDVLSFLSNPPILRIRQTAAQTITTSTVTYINFDTEDVDSSGMHSNVTNPMNATAVYPGWYWCSGGVGFAANATGFRQVFWAYNGSSSGVLGAGSDQTTVTAAATARIPIGATLIFMNVGDNVRIGCFHNVGSNLLTAVTNAGGEQPSMALTWASN